MIGITLATARWAALKSAPLCKTTIKSKSECVVIDPVAAEPNKISRDGATSSHKTPRTSTIHASSWSVDTGLAVSRNGCTTDFLIQPR